ncbi:MAG: potassium channel protein [Candidatus Dadabacteria bacterium]|nr:MAG: potassium channel protein [Candidatus Dadabacteria bacterium]
MPQKHTYPYVTDSKEIALAIIAVLSILIIGTTGFRLIEGWNTFDSLYMTVLTISTVGFREVHPLSDHGRLFAIFLIFLGVSTATAVFTTVAKALIQQQVTRVFRRQRMDETIERLSSHTIICGYGRLSRITASVLQESGLGVVIVDSGETGFERAVADGFLAVHGDATSEDALLKAGIKKAARLISLLPKDSDNLYVILTARELNPDLYIISRSEDETGEKRLIQAGADKVTAPYRIGGHKIANSVLRPYVTDFLDLAVSNSSESLQIEEILIPKGCPIDGVTLREANIRKTANVIIVAVISESGEMIFNPSSDTVIKSGTTIIGMGLKQEFEKLQSLLTTKEGVQ